MLCLSLLHPAMVPISRVTKQCCLYMCVSLRKNFGVGKNVRLELGKTANTVIWHCFDGGEPIFLVVGIFGRQLDRAKPNNPSRKQYYNVNL
ncbi:hypothetical protein VNO77_17242 [Canavalia gladiata]|uniref:Uncharacterized protein n=1 Tax=Canavalia gladiata TaxID=3824 RepID=A0AAN9QJ74_CANGL